MCAYLTTILVRVAPRNLPVKHNHREWPHSESGMRRGILSFLLIFFRDSTAFVAFHGKIFFAFFRSSTTAEFCRMTGI